MKSKAIAAGLVAFTAAAYAQSGGDPGESSASRTTAERFVYRAAITNLFEIDAAVQAESKTSNPAYEDFVKMIIADHTNMRNGLKKRVDKLSDAAIPRTLDYDHQRKLTELGSEAGMQFEKDYRQNQIDGNRQTLQLFRDFASNSSNAGDADLRSWAKASIPTLQKDLQRAEELPGDSRSAVTTGNTKVRTDSSARGLVNEAEHLFKRWRKTNDLLGR
jgi:putative membrane protein